MLWPDDSEPMDDASAALNSGAERLAPDGLRRSDPTRGGRPIAAASPKSRTRDRDGLDDLAPGLPLIPPGAVARVAGVDALPEMN